MRQGNGTDILGLNDPRAANIGIIYVSPTDERRNVLAAILTQEKYGRKQVAVVLPPQNKAFQRPTDFDELKNMRNRLQTQVVFIAPSGPGPGEFARQRRFPVYSSLESYAQALRQELPVEEVPKKGWSGRSEAKPADAARPTPRTPSVPAEQGQAERGATGHPTAPLVGGMLAGGAAGLAADQLLRRDRVADASPAAPVPSGAEDDFSYAPDLSASPAAPLSPSGASPNQASATTAPNAGSRLDSGSVDSTPKQPRGADDSWKAAPFAPVPLDLSPTNRASRQRNSGKIEAVGAGAAGGAAGGTLAGRAGASAGAPPPIVRGTPSGKQPPGGSRRRRGFTLLLIVALLLASLLLCSGVAFALPNQTQAVTSTVTKMVSNIINPQSSSSSPMVTITPASKVVQDTYSIQAVPSGANPAQHQVAARIITASPSQQKTVTATGHVHSQGAQATGSLTFFNGSTSPYTVAAGTIFTDANGVQVTNNVPAVIPATGSVTVPAHAVRPGAAGNIPADDFSFVTCCGSSLVKVSNTAPFTGGQDAKDYMFLQQSDVDRVANPLKDTLLAQAKSSVKSQILPTEQAATTLQCTSPTATVNQPVGDTGVNVTSATVTVSVSCSQEVYDQHGVQTLVEGLLKAKAAADPTLAGYALVGDIVSTTKVQHVDPKTGIVTLGVTAKGMWVDQLDAKALAQLIAGLTAEQARTKLLAQPGVASVSINVASLPSDPTKITIDIVKVPGFSGGGGSSTPVPGPGTPTSPTVQPGGG